MTTVLALKAPATESQIAKIHEVLDEKYTPEQAAEHHEWMNTHIISKAAASAALKRLFAMPNVNELDEGMYRVGDDIFKVYFTRGDEHRDPQLVTKTLTEDGFEYTGKKPLRHIKPEHRMTLDEAKAYGKVTGTCCQCGRKLTNETSIAEGIGPRCAGKI